MPDIDRDVLPEPFELEIVDLEATEEAKTSWQSSLPGRLLSRWRFPVRPGQRRRLGNLLLICLMLVLLAALLNPSVGLTPLLAAHWPFHSMQVGSTTNLAPANPLALAPAKDIICPVQDAWSPDSRLIAVLGYTQPCNQAGYIVAQVDLYDASTARRIGSWRPDSLVFAALQQSISPPLRASLDHKPDPSGNLAVPAIDYQQIIWSPDNTSLALSFAITTRFEPYRGLFLMKRSGAQGPVLLYPETPSAAARQAPALLWNLQSGQGTPLAALSPSLAYSWDSGDRLLPVSMLSLNSSPGTNPDLSTGSPDGGHSFTVWQPGHTIILSLMHEPAAYLWSTNFAVWSPDGHWLITNFAFAGLMEPPGRPFPTSQVLKEMEVENVPRLPAHDPALIATATGARVEAWNPAGTVLAVYDLGGTVDLYASQNGQLLRSLKPSSAHSLAGSAALLNWSPDGHTLLLSSSQWGLVSLWRGASLALT